MRLTVAALVLASVLSAHAQTPPDTPPASPPDAAPASPPAAAAQAVPAPDQAPVPEVAPDAAPAEKVERPTPRPPPTVRAPLAHSESQPPTAATAAAAHPAAEYDEQLRELRAQVSRLQSELDAERAAALAAAEDLSGAQAPRGAWGWLAVAAVLALATGFVLGWRVLDRRIRRKYGGLRIY
ncbi:MAG TPA: hypothetical protein VKT54_10555 [Steroidobacteraceae bacterium]|nr:hypothetical protein [Steroidobacteraceae bacterium]